MTMVLHLTPCTVATTDTTFNVEEGSPCSQPALYEHIDFLLKSFYPVRTNG